MAGLVSAAAAAQLLTHTAPRLGDIRLGVVDGPSGSGKSTFAQAWARACEPVSSGPVALLSTDLLATWDDPFDWWDRLEDSVLRPLSRGRPGRLLANDWSTGVPVPGRLVTIAPPAILILEGVSAGRWAIADRVGLLAWLELPDRAERLRRAVERDGEASRRFLQQWQDDEDRHFTRDGTKLRADLVVRAS